MQAWIPVVSSSLYFWKSVFSFRADSILKSDGDFMSNWKFPDCVHSFGAWARQAVIEAIAVMYELTKRTQEKLFADWAQQYKAFFVPNQEPAFTLLFGNGPVRVGTQGLFRPCLKSCVAPFLPARLTAPGSPRMGLSLHEPFTSERLCGWTIKRFNGMQWGQSFPPDFLNLNIQPHQYNFLVTCLLAMTAKVMGFL